jgi:hypothetical protein
MEKITNSAVENRWQNSRIPPTKAEMTSMQILKVRIVDASAKARNGGPGDDKTDLKNEELRANTWIGVVPSWITFDEPIAGSENRVKKACDLCYEVWLSANETKVPKHITSFVKKENEVREKIAKLAVMGEASDSK